MSRPATRQLLQVGYRQFMWAGRIALALICFGSVADDPEVLAQKSRERVKGVANFGRVTATYFRGGEVTPEGLKNLAGMGVRTVIDLREEADDKEKAVCQQLGMTYYSFPMTTEDTPDPAKIENIVRIIREAKSPVYVHCSGGKHRTGTVCAYFRIKDQSWSAEKAWQEQQSYGFGTPEEHSNLFSYIYGNTPVAKKLQTESASAVAEKAEGKAATAGASTAKSVTASGGASAATSAKGGSSPEGRAGEKTESVPHPEGVLSATVKYISTTNAVETARGHGGSGEAIRINLEYDKKRTAPVWKVLFATGTEYRLHAVTGELLGTKTKAEKLSFLKPLDLGQKHWTFQQVIAKAERRGGAKVIEMELKSVRGRNRTFFEVMLADGITLFFEAAGGHQIRAF